MLQDDHKPTFEARLTEHDIDEAIKCAPAGKATGLDGLPYELWKDLRLRHERTKKPRNPAVNINAVLTAVFNDIELNGVHEESGFAAGWLCPLSEKGDARLVSSYRPIALLNTGYKLFTKCYALKLAKVAHTMIHENQAGFVRKHSIFDQVRLTKLMLECAETTEQNGVIVALDQEKAYDKVSHDYLLKTLAAFNIPEEFISTIRSLYEHAETVVYVNGESSSPFRVTRGVRQGDPLSCLLFDLAIEPPACMIRQSELKGFEVPGLPDRVLVSHFADDTTAYLSSSDDFSDLTDILQKWCVASRAKFNEDKTQIIPIGTAEYRAAALTSRQLAPGDAHSPRIPEHMAMVPDGVAIRILGVWLGNDLHENTPKPWADVIARVNAALVRWKRCKPGTLRGKRLIVQMIVGGMTQYLAKVQGMPSSVEDEFVRIIRDFVSDGKKSSPIKPETLFEPIREGGIKLLDIKSRNEAIELTWVQSYLTLSPHARRGLSSRTNCCPEASWCPTITSPSRTGSTCSCNPGT